MDQTARTAKQLGQALRRQRRALGMTQAELGAKTQRRQATISDLENGAGGTQIATLVDVLAALQLELLVRTRGKGASADIETLF